MKVSFSTRSWTTVACLLSLVPLLASSASADDAAQDLATARQAMERASGGPVEVRSSRLTGLASFVKAARGIPVAGASAEERALAFLAAHGKAFGLRGSGELRHGRSTLRDLAGMDHVRYQQVHEGVPVTGAELVVHLRGALVTAANGRTLPNLDGFSTQPLASASAALKAAREVLSKHLDVSDAALSEPRLEIFDRGLIGGPPAPKRLAWFVEATRFDLRQFIWVDARTGGVLLRFSQLPEAKSRKIYTANSTAVLPGTLLRNEGGPPTGDPDADAAYDFAGDTYDYYLNEHGRDSYDGAGSILKSTVHACPNIASCNGCPCLNAFWNGTQMVYGDGFPLADDVDGHELTHAVTDTSAGLFYYMQSGALNESYSDIFGETVDLTNGAGNDTPGARWFVGEDEPNFGAVRDMLDPTTFGHPGKMSDAEFVCQDPGPDVGGVHSNSGVPNHAYQLMVDGGSYNGFTITGIGLTKAGKIQYRTLTSYLTTASDFLDNHDALNQSCNDLIGVAGITAGDCGNVADALSAVEMDAVWGGPTTPCPPTQPTEPALCSAGQGPVNVFFDDLENTKSTNWTTTLLSGGNHWSFVTPRFGVPAIYYQDFATSGLHHFWGYDVGAAGNSTVNMARSFVLPAGARMQFNHSFGFENLSTIYFDGGVLEYSTDNGGSWLDAGGLIAAGATYNGTLEATTNNPLAGRSAFVGESWGYTSTQLDLSPLAGQSVRFRFRIGTDSVFEDYGWFVDDVRIYTCDVGGSVELSGPSFTGSEAAGTATITATRSGGQAEGVAVDYFSSGGSATPGSDYTAVSGSLSFGSGVSSRTFSVPITNDTVDDDGETVGLSLTNVSGPSATLGAQDQATLAITDNDVAGTIQLSSASYSVGEAVPNATITVSRTGGSASGVTVDYQASNGTAIAPGDYSAVSGSVTFAAGKASATFTVPIVNDAIDESNETVSLLISNAGGGGVLGARTTATLTITDNDAGGALQFSAAGYTLSEGGGSALITVSRSGGAAEGVTVDYATADGSASAGSDYTASSGTLSFAAGQASRTFLVPILEDSRGENNETVRLSLSAPTGGASLGVRATSTLTITENETVLQFSAAQFSVGEASPKATITVKRSGVTTGAASVQFLTGDAVALAGSDYTAISGTLDFPAKVTTKTFMVSILQDAQSEGPEPLVLSLSSPSGGVLGPNSTSALVINDDDAQLTFSVAAYSGKEGGPAAIVTVKRNGTKTTAASVDYATSDGTANAGADYTAASGVLSFASGAVSKTFTVPIADDGNPETAETVNLSLSNPIGASLGRFAAVLTITDNEPVLAFGAANYTVSEGVASATITVKRTGPSTASVSVNYTTSNGSATAGPDYTTSSGVLTFAAGIVSRTFAVAIVPDATAEPAETVNLTLSSPSGASLGLSASTLNITDNDPSISFGAASYPAKESAKSVTVTVKRTGDTSGSASVDYATSNGTASAGSDYTAASGSLSFGPKVVSRTFSVPLQNDTLDETDETVNLSLSNPSGGVLGQAGSTLTITDDDVAGKIELQAASFSGGETGGFALVTLKRSGGSASGASVQYATSNGTANAGSDYTATSGTLSFAAGETSRTFEVPILADGIPEATETLNVALSAPGGGATLEAQTSAVVYVVSSDVLPTLSINDVSLGEGDAGTVNATFSVTLTPASSQTVTVDFATANGTASTSADYTAASGSLTFNPTETTQNVSVTVIGDTNLEGNETFFVNLSNPVNAAFGDSQGQGTILNDELPGLSINDVTLTEGNSGTSNANFTVTLSSASQSSVTVQYATANGTASGGVPATQTFSNASLITILDNAAGSPYPSTIAVPALSGTVTKVTAQLSGFGHAFPRDTDVLLVGPGGQTVVLMSDVGGGGPGVTNRNLTFDDSGASLPTTAFASGTYRPTNNEDNEPPGDSFPGPAPGGPYGNLMSAFNGVNPTGTWSLYVFDDFLGDSGSVTGGWSLTITTSGDYSPSSGTLTFSAGATSRMIAVPVVGETIEEPDETFFVNLSGAVNATITDSQGLGTITNNDCADSDSDRLCDSHETNTGVFVSPTNTGTDPSDPDTDGDQLPDGDEVLGTLAGLDLPALGTNPLKQNILLEYDWMNDSVGCGSHSHQPTQAIVDRVSAAFAAATVSNPDGSTGIVTIHDFGQGGAFTGGNLLSGTNVTGGVSGTNFQSRKSSNFAANRNGYFHYVILPHEYTDSPGSSGQAELPGDDLIVSMGCFGSLQNTSNTIMHELGHNLLLGHGGFEHCNWKPNYNSVMNYRFQFPGIDTSCNAVGSSGEANTLDYSRGTRIALNENNLNENQGTCGSTAIDWNFSGGITTGVVFDLNQMDENPGPGTGVDNAGCAAALTTLNDSDDWATMVLTGLSDADGRPLRPFEVIDCNNPWLARTRPEAQ